MAWVVQHYIPLAGVGTAPDPDPTVDQPGKFAKDGAGNDLPITAVKHGIVQADAVVVNDAGAAVSPQPAVTFDIKIAKRTTSLVLPAAGTVPAQQIIWNSGPTATAAAPGLEVAQSQMESPSIVTVVVTGANGTPPASGRLAVRIWVAP